MDSAQNLITIACKIADQTFEVDNERLYIDLGALDGDGHGAHPEAAGKTLFLSELSRREYSIPTTESWKLEGLGRHIAFRRTLLQVHHLGLPGGVHSIWGNRIRFLQIWDWQHSTTSNCVLIDTVRKRRIGESLDFCFLGNDRLLIVSEDLKS